MSGPVFLFTTHRSGGTLLARVLNCHPDMLIWGEHAGFINKLAELDAILGYYPPVDRPLAQRDLERFALAAKADPAVFDPWANPLERADFREWCRGFIQQSFRRRLRRGQRWGFKEVRYHTVLTAKFLAELFPDGQFVILRRDLAALTLSNMLAPWSIDHLRAAGATADAAQTLAALDDCAYALTAIDDGFQSIARALPARCHVMTHEALAAAPEPALANLFAFLRLPVTPDLLETIRAVVNTRSGGTDFGNGHGCLDRAFVERHVAEALAEARAAIAASGPDLARLKRFAGGRYSYLVGDHQLADTPFSAMF